MNAKHLFLTLTMLLASITFAWGGTATDNLTSSGLSGGCGWSKSGHYSVSDIASTSSARYGVDIRWNKASNYLMFQLNESCIVSTISGGILTQVAVTWYGANADKRIEVYGSNTAYSGSETRVTLSSDPNSELIATITYDATATVDLSSYGYHYVALVSNNALNVSGISVTWTEEVSYNVKMDAGYNSDYGYVEINGVEATAGATVTTAKAGETVTIEITPEFFYCLKSFTFGDMEFDMSCIGYLEEAETGTYNAARVYLEDQYNLRNPVNNLNDRTISHFYNGKSNLGKNIRAMRIKKNLSVQEFSDKIGVTPQTVYRWEKNERMPDVVNFMLIADVFGIDAHELLK